MQSKASSPACQLILTDRKGEHSFSSSDIIRLQAVRSYTVLHIAGRRPFMIAKVLKVYQDLLEPYGFVRTHRSHLVNRQYIQRVEKKTIVMKDASVAAIARNRKADVHRRLKQEAPVLDNYHKWAIILSIGFYQSTPR